MIDAETRVARRADGSGSFDQHDSRTTTSQLVLTLTAAAHYLLQSTNATMADEQAPDFHKAVRSDTIFRNDIFKGKVLFCTGGGITSASHLHTLTNRPVSQAPVAFAMPKPKR